MRNKKFLLILFAFLFWISCEKDSLLENSGGSTLLKQVLIEGKVYYEYTYNKLGLVVEEKSKFHYTKHVYNGKNQLVQSDSYWDERIASSSSYVLEEAMNRTEWVSPENTEKDVYSTFQYKRNGQLEKRTTYRINNDNSSYSLFAYDKQRRIARRTSYTDGKATLYDEYSYDSIGNLIKMERFNILGNGSAELRTTHEYEFDNKHNPYYSLKGLLIPGQNTNPNNITKDIYTLHFEVDDFIDPIQITEYSYDYNSEGYPVRNNYSFEFIYD